MNFQQQSGFNLKYVLDFLLHDKTLIHNPGLMAKLAR